MVKAKFNFLLLERAGILVILAGSSVASALSYVQKHKAPFSGQGSVAQNEDSPFRKREVDTTFEKQYQKLWMGGSRRQIIDTLLYARDLSRERTLELVENLERENDALAHIYEMEYGWATPDVAGNESQPFGTENTLADNFKVVLRRSDPVKITNRHRKVRRFEVNFDFHERSGKTSVPLFIVIKDNTGKVINSKSGGLTVNQQKLDYSAVFVPNHQPNDQQVRCQVELDKKLSEKGAYQILVYHPYGGLIGSDTVQME